MNYYLNEEMAVYEKDGRYYPVFTERYGEDPVEVKEDELVEITHPKEILSLDKYMTPYGEGTRKIYMAGPLFNEGDRYTN